MPPPDLVPFFVIAGPTAVGKSELAVAVAERCGGEIVSADAFQVYAGLEILTAQPGPELRARVPHHLIGEIPLSDSFDVARYLTLARERITAIRKRGRVPIVAGGSGLYLRALTHGLADLPPADPSIRAQFEAHDTSELGRLLAERDPLGHSQIDLQNRRRIIRALEVCLLTGRPFSSFRQEWNGPTPIVNGVLLQRERPEMVERIARRTAAMFAGGIIEEVSSAGEAGPTASQTIGWREIGSLLNGTISQEECINSIQQATRQYAKRQMTWFRKEQSLEPAQLVGAELSDRLIEDLAQRARATS